MERKKKELKTLTLDTQPTLLHLPPHNTNPDSTLTLSSSYPLHHLFFRPSSPPQPSPKPSRPVLKPERKREGKSERKRGRRELRQWQAAGIGGGDAQRQRRCTGGSGREAAEVVGGDSAVSGLGGFTVKVRCNLLFKFY